MPAPDCCESKRNSRRPHCARRGVARPGPPQTLLSPTGALYLVALDANRPHELIDWFRRETQLVAQVGRRLPRSSGRIGRDKAELERRTGRTRARRPLLRQIVLSRRAGMESLHILRVTKTAPP